ncbi:MAG: sulfotransferase domain-containing protein, partial [Gemmataceae bacterium]
GYLDRYVQAMMQAHHDSSSPAPADETRAALIQALARAVFQTAMQLSGKPLVVDKITPYEGTVTTVVASLKQFFPEARIVLLLRDGRDVLTSGVFHWLNKHKRGSVESELVKNRRAIFLGQGPRIHNLPRFFSDEEIRHWARHWAQILDALHSCADLVIRYEDMVAGHLHVLRALSRCLGVNEARSCLERCVQASTFEVMSGGRARGQELPAAHVRKGIVGDWRNYFTQRDGQIFSEETGRWLIETGYEKDERWWQRAPGRLGDRTRVAA